MYIHLLEFIFDMNSYSDFPKESFIPEDLKANSYADRQLQGLAVSFTSFGPEKLGRIKIS